MNETKNAENTGTTTSRNSTLTGMIADGDSVQRANSKIHDRG